MRSRLDDIEDLQDLDLSEFGLKVGLEIHRQLDGGKLFCGCCSDLSDGRHLMVRRKLRLTRSELGEEDAAASGEVAKQRVNTYQVLPSECLVELDEEPPHMPSSYHLETALIVVEMFSCVPPSELLFMRKIVADGSDTSGFQRTALVGLDGNVEVRGRKVGISTICLEEDAARKVSDGDAGPIYRLDRLGTPEVEIATEPTMDDPELAGTVAREIGSLLRSTGRVKRGIGTVRQDVNVSIDGAQRTELKLVQDLNLIPWTIRTEAIRQLLLMDVARELRDRGVGPTTNPFFVVDVTDIFSSTSSNVIFHGLNNGGRALAIGLKGYAGLMGEKTVQCRLEGMALKRVRRHLDDVRRLGPEFAQHVRVRTGLKGLFHSDELPGYGIVEEEVRAVRDRLGSDHLRDGFIIVCAQESTAVEALRAVHQRAASAIVGVPSEVRRPLSDGTSEFMRPMPGAARMYPETDITPIPITRELLERISGMLPEPPSVRMERLRVSMGLSEETIRSLSNLDLLDILEGMVSSSADPKLASMVLLQGFPRAREKGFDPSVLSNKALIGVLSGIKQGAYAKEAVPDVLCRLLGAISEGKGEVEALSLIVRSEGAEDGIGRVMEAARRLVCEKKGLISERGMGAFGPLMGILMKEFRGKVDGEAVSRVLKEEVEKAVEGGR